MYKLKDSDISSSSFDGTFTSNLRRPIKTAVIRYHDPFLNVLENSNDSINIMSSLANWSALAEITRNKPDLN